MRMPNAPGYTQRLIEEFSWKQFNHPPYSLDLAQSDFHFFLHVRCECTGKSYACDDNALLLSPGGIKCN